MPQSPLPPDVEQTEVGSYFVANYPPFSVWNTESVADEARPALAAPPVPGVPLGLYLHIPFCRKRCHFCYFRVYTDAMRREVESYLDRAGARMGALCADAGDRRPAASTSCISAAAPRRSSRPRSCTRLVDRLTAATPWNGAEEITFECEPGTLTEAKLSAIRSMGVTRLSLGVENFDDASSN